MTRVTPQAHIRAVAEAVEARSYNEPEFLQAMHEVLDTLEPVLAEHPEYIDAGILERLVEPERQIDPRIEPRYSRRRPRHPIAPRRRVRRPRARTRRAAPARPSPAQTRNPLPPAAGGAGSMRRR